MAELVLSKGITKENLDLIYSDRYIIDAISFGDSMPIPIVHDLVDYLSVFSDGEFIGAIILIHFSDYETEVHSLLLKSARIHSREICHMLQDYCFTELPILRVTAYVMEKLNSAKNNLLKCGFTYEGFRRCAYIKNGMPEGMHILGVTVDEWRKTR